MELHVRACHIILFRSQIRACRRWEPWQSAEQQRTEQELQAKSVAKSVTAVSSARSARTAPRFVSRLGAGAGPRRRGESRPPRPPFSTSILTSKGRRPEGDDGGGGEEAARFLNISGRIAQSTHLHSAPDFSTFRT